MNIDELEIKVNITNLEKMLCLLKEIKALAAEMFDEKSEDYLFSSLCKYSCVADSFISCHDEKSELSDM